MGRKPANFLTALDPEPSPESTGPRPLKQNVPTELAGAMRQFSLSSAELLWEVATDPGHPWYKLWGFKALEILFTKSTPIFKEAPEAPAMQLNIGAMLHANSIEGPDEESLIEIEVQKKEEAQPEKGKVDLPDDSGGSV